MEGICIVPIERTIQRGMYVMDRSDLPRLARLPLKTIPSTSFPDFNVLLASIMYNLHIHYSYLCRYVSHLRPVTCALDGA